MHLRLRELNTKYLNLSPSHRPVIYEFNFFSIPDETRRTNMIYPVVPAFG